VTVSGKSCSSVGSLLSCSFLSFSGDFLFLVMASSLAVPSSFRPESFPASLLGSSKKKIKSKKNLLLKKKIKLKLKFFI
jgi:hypothetical protein